MRACTLNDLLDDGHIGNTINKRGRDYIRTRQDKILLVDDCLPSGMDTRRIYSTTVLGSRLHRRRVRVHLHAPASSSVVRAIGSGACCFRSLGAFSLRVSFLIE